MDKKEYPEKEMVKYNTLNSKNLYRLLVFLRNIYPIGYSLKGLRGELEIEILPESLLGNLVEEGFIKKRKLGILKEFEKMVDPKFLEGWPEYIIASKGVEFINSIEVRNLNKSMHINSVEVRNLNRIMTRITIALVAMGLVTTFYTLMQNLISLGWLV